MSKVYIELGEAINAIKSSRGNCDSRFYDEGLMDACSEIIGLKPADVEPVVHGKWIPIINYFHGKPDGRYYCSECHRVETMKGIYCRLCGALMDGGNK